ncbi:MAG TPA: hypothetical protein VH044_12485 [Polyangiaceae bacterium]|jgi:hypothetical protein|nr:hypothetical protein [Polyangiaceae bacterium]
MKAARYAMAGSLVVATGTLLLANQSCSVIENKFDQQCNTTQDCVDLANRQPRLPDGGPSVSGLVCSDQHVCVPESGCHSNAECQLSNGGVGSAYICRQSDRTCQSLTLPSPDGGEDICKVLADPADYSNENTIWLGAAVLYKDDSYQGLEMVRQDFNHLASGLPPASAGSSARRPLAFVYCDGETIDVTGQHLVNDLQLPVIITSLDTTTEISLLQNYSIANGNTVFQLSTSAGGELLKTIDNKGQLIDLVLINENYDKESAAIVKNYYTPTLQTAGTVPANTPPRVAVLHSSTPTYANTSTKIVTALQSAQTPSTVVDFGYGDSANPTGTDAEYLAVVANVLAFKPNVVIVLGDNEIASVDLPIEAQWATAVPDQPPPQWLALLGAVGELPIDMGTLDPATQLNWAGRSLFVQQHYDFNGSQFTSYLAQLEQLFPTDPDGIWEAEQSSPYNEFLREGAYVTAYGIALLAGENKPLTGANIAAAARTFGMQNPMAVTVGPSGIFPGLQTTATGKPLNLLNFQGWTGFNASGFANYALADDVDCLAPGTPTDDGGLSLGALAPTGAQFDATGTFLNSISLTSCAH